MAKLKTVTKQKSKSTSKTTARDVEVRARILDIQGQKEKGYVNLAILLFEAYIQKYYEGWGYNDFKSYAEGELATKYRKAMNFVEIGERAKSLNLSEERLEQIGWSKLRLLASVLTEKNAEDWLKQAEGSSYRELEETVRTNRVGNGELPDRPKTIKLSFKMSEAESGVILSAIEEAKGLIQSDNLTLAIEMICSDWLETKGSTPQKANLDNHIQYLERVYACKLEVKDEEEVIQEELLDNSEDVPLPEEKKEIEKVEIAKSKGKEAKSKSTKDTSAKSKTKKEKQSVSAKASLEKTESSVEKEKSTGDEQLDDLLGI